MNELKALELLKRFAELDDGGNSELGIESFFAYYGELQDDVSVFLAEIDERVKVYGQGS